MAYSVVETRVANPAGRTKNVAKKKKLRRKLTAKQIKHFGTPAQKAALKRKRSNSAKKKYTVKKKRKNPSPKRVYKKVARKVSRAFKKKTRKNPVPEIISFALGNPGSRKGKKKMASKKKGYKKAASKRNAGHYTKRRKTTRHAKRRNPAGLGRPMDWVKGGAGVIAGGVGTRLIPQLAGAMNTGGVGYAMNAAAAIALAWAAHAFLKDGVITGAVAAGGFAALFLRMIGDLTPYGQTLSLSGFGDYMVSNWVTPQRMLNPNSAMWEIPNGWGNPNVLAVPQGMQAQSGADSRNSGNSY